MRRALLLCLFSLLDLSTRAQAQDSVTVVGDFWCPFNCNPKDTDKPGFFVEILRNALAKEKISLKYEISPWARAVHDANEGKVDGLFAAGKDDIVEAHITKQPLALYGDCYFTHPDSQWSYQSIDSLKSITLATVKDYAYGKDLLDFIKAHPKNIEASVGDEPLKLNIKKVMAKRVDALVEDRSVATYTMSEVKTQLRSAGCGQSSGLYVPFSKKSKLGQRANDALESWLLAAARNGDLAKLKSKYRIEN